MNFSDIPGWFDFPDIYDEAVARADHRYPIFVEIGCWLGRSTAYLAQRIKESGKHIKLYAIDHFRGNPEDPQHFTLADQNGGSVYDIFDANMRACGVRDIITTITEPSPEASTLFLAGECDFIFIDASHTYEAVKRDLQAWLPKLSPEGGILAGHDYHNPEVRRAVDELIQAEARHSSWIMTQPYPASR